MRLTVSWSPEGALLTLAIALFPFYVFPSGGVQPSHLAFLLMSILAIGRYGVPKQDWLMLLAILAAYSFLIETIAATIVGDPSHLINSAFFLFNFLLMAGVYRTTFRYGASVLKIGVLSAAIFAVISVYIGGVDLREIGEGGRPTGTSNNPNQLGFFSVCILSLTYLIYLEKQIIFPTMLALLATSIVLAVASLSKAAILANFAVLFFSLRPRRRGAVLWAVLVLGGVCGVIYLTADGYFEEFLFYNRIANMAQEQDSSLAERGYFAFLEGNILQNIFGMGSPDVYRIVGHEVHSTFASIWNTYGVLGIALFIPIFVIWGLTLRRAYGLGSMIVLMGPAILYGITHNGARFSIFWLLLAASMATAHREVARLHSSSDRHFVSRRRMRLNRP